MPNAIRIPTPIELKKRTGVMQIRGTDVFVRWSVFLIAAVMLAGVLRQPVVTAFALIAYLGVLLIHESGHLVAAQWKRCEVLSIELYPVFGVTYFQTPWSRFDHCVIAWGGGIAQAIVALPIVTWIAIFGYTRFEAINAILALLGPFSLGVAAINLIPVGRLDGAVAWGLIPELVRRVSDGRNKRGPRSWK